MQQAIVIEYIQSVPFFGILAIVGVVFRQGLDFLLRFQYRALQLTDQHLWLFQGPVGHAQQKEKQCRGTE